MFRWYVEFKRGRSSFQDEARSGRSNTAVTLNNINFVWGMMQHDARNTCKGIEKKLTIGLAAANTILHDHLAVMSAGDVLDGCPSAVR